jgi:Tfp pilus assembly protein PilZ
MGCLKGDPMSEDDQNSERRHQRVEASIDVRISTIEPERDPWTGRPFFRASHETCVNLSRGGAFVRTSEPLREGRRLLVEIHLPNGEPIEAIGRVAWTRRTIEPGATAQEKREGAGIGIEFLGGATDQLSALEEYISTNSDIPSDPVSDA